MRLLEERGVVTLAGLQGTRRRYAMTDKLHIEHISTNGRVTIISLHDSYDDMSSDLSDALKHDNRSLLSIALTRFWRVACSFGPACWHEMTLSVDGSDLPFHFDP